MRISWTRAGRTSRRCWSAAARTARSSGSSTCPTSLAGRSKAPTSVTRSPASSPIRVTCARGSTSSLREAFVEPPTAPDRGQHPAGQSRLDRAGARRRLRSRGLLAALPQDRRTLARPRAVGDSGRGLARAQPASRAAGRALIAGPDGDPPTGTARQRPPLTESSPVQRAARRFRSHLAGDVPNQPRTMKPASAAVFTSPQ